MRATEAVLDNSAAPCYNKAYNKETTEMNTEKQNIYAAVLSHDAHEMANVILSWESQEDANAKATKWLLEETASYRTEGMTDEEWLDLLYEGEWTFEEGTVR
jgi:hypothetical protein